MNGERKHLIPLLSIVVLIVVIAATWVWIVLHTHAPVDIHAPIYEGMQMDEVRLMLGKPHRERYLPGGTIQWLYYGDRLEFKLLAIEFSREHVVIDVSN